MTSASLKLIDVSEWADREPSIPDYLNRENRRFEEDEAGYNLFWGPNPTIGYFLAAGQIDTPFKACHHLSRILKKGWPHATPERAAMLIEHLNQRFSWDIYYAGKQWLDAYRAPVTKVVYNPRKVTDRQTSATEERAKLTPSLRYDVLVRDDFRCRACGASPETGAHLHIDHIHPISSGGKTVLENLQALCSACNFGKGAR